jgi:hypothetical protein
VAGIQDDLSHRIRVLEKELQAELEQQSQAFRYQLIQGKAKFEDEILAVHRAWKRGLGSYLLQSRILVALTAPVIYLGVIPFALLDLFLVVYQGSCFPIYGIPKVKRSEYVFFDRGHLKYLNLLERLNCIYCSYGNGLLAFATEVAARTEQYWCPIKHARRLRAPHSRYPHFLEYGDAKGFREQGGRVSADFVDVRDIGAAPGASTGD